MTAVQQIDARDLRAGDVIHFGGARAHVTGVRHDAALVVVGIEELGAFLTFEGPPHRAPRPPRCRRRGAVGAASAADA